MNATATALRAVEDPRTLAEQAVDLWIELSRQGDMLTGEELGQRFDRQSTWGRTQINKAKAIMAAEAATVTPEPATPPVVEPTPEVVKALNEPSAEPQHLRESPGHKFATWVSTSGAKTLVRVAAAIGSYGHQFKLAQHVGEGWLAYVWPLIADALVWRCLQRSTIVARLVLALALFVSIGANIVMTHSPEGALVAAWPPAALLLDHLVENSKRERIRKQK